MKLILFFSAVLCLLFTSCNSSQTTQKSDTTSYANNILPSKNVNPIPDSDSKLIDTNEIRKEAAKSSPNEPDFEASYRDWGDISDNRSLVIRKLKDIDPSADFSGNFAEGSDKLDDSFEAPDKYGCDIQVIGSRKHLKEVNFTYRENPYFNDSKNIGYGKIIKIGRMFCKQQGENWTELYLAAINSQPQHAFKDSVIINDKKLIMENEPDKHSITFTIRHKVSVPKDI
jgi:hypothetical protein